MNFISKLLSTNYFLLVILLLASSLPLPSIHHGLQTDDYMHWSVFHSDLSASEAVHSLFTFIEPASANHALAKNMGTLPWWTSNELTINFWRPVAAFTHWLDYQWWPNNTVLMHLHNIFWFVLLVLACFYFYKRMVGETEPQATMIVALATFLFCVDFSHFANISWLANRNSLICALMCVLALLMHHQWRTQKTIYFLMLSQLFLLLALASNEAGLIAFLWIVAYNWVFEKNTFTEKVFNTLPSLAIFIGWQTLYQYLGFGFSNSGLYLHPIYDFSIVAVSIIEKVPVFIFSQIFGFEGFYNGFAPHVRYLFSTFCFITSGLFLLAAYKYVFYKNTALNRHILFLALCTILAFIPASAFGLMEIRMSLYAGIPSALLVSYCLVHAVKIFHNSKAQLQKRFLLGFVIFFLVFAHLVLAVGQWSLQWKNFQLQTKKSNNISYLIKPLLENNDNKNYQGKDLVILGAPSAIDYYYLPFVAAYYGLQTPRSINLLALNHTPYQVYVENEQRLVITSAGLLLNRYQNRQVFNSAGTFSPWYAIHDFNGIFTFIDSTLDKNVLDGAKFTTMIEIKNNHQQITKVIFNFDTKLSNITLDSENTIFLYWNNNQYTEVSYQTLKEVSFFNKGI